jgi:hypothetical protein
MIKRIALLIFSAALMLALAACERGTAVPAGTRESPSAPEQTDSEPTETETPSMPVALYLPNANVDGLIVKAAMTDGTPEHIVSMLVSEKALPDGCALLDFAIASNGSCRADMNAAYSQSLGKGTAAEYLRLGSVVNTLLTYFELEEITLTIEGATLETGHEIYDYPLRFFENQTADFGNGEESPPGEAQNTSESSNNGGIENADTQNENDLSDTIANLPRSDAADIIWHRLSGYWTATDNLFVGFVYQDGIPGIEYGVWESEGRGFGEFIGADKTGEYTAGLIIRFPATEANEIYDARPETTAVVFVDVSGLDNDGKINIKIENQGSGDYYTYAYGGASAEETYRSVH